MLTDDQVTAIFIAVVIIAFISLMSEK